MNPFTAVFLIALAANTVLHVWLDRRHIRHVTAHRHAVPAAFAAQVPLAAHQKAADYTTARIRFGLIELLFGAVVLLGWTLGGALSFLDRAWRLLALPELTTGVAFLISVFALMAIIDLPASIYRTFVIEQRHGFNRTTPRTFVSDLIKKAVLLLLLGTPLSALVLWLMHHAGALWWLYVWLTWMGFSLLMLWAFPVLIAPLFNRFEPLTDSGLIRRINDLLTRTGFKSKGIFVMDGSRRSSHGNAYFTGFGRNRRIVFFDTLIKELNVEEIEAVLAHELGHFKRRHVVKRVALMAATSLGGLAVLGVLINRPWFYTGLGIEQPSVHVALILFLMVTPVFTFLLHPVMAWLSRRHEFEADDFAARQADARALIQALIKLYKENANTLTPDPLYSAYHDSHPPAPVRIAHLAAQTR